MRDEGNSPKVSFRAAPSSKDSAARDCHFCFVGIVYVELILVEYCDIVGVCEFGDAEEGVAFDTGDDVDVLRGVAHVVMEFVDFGCRFHSAVGHVESFVGLPSCG